MRILNYVYLSIFLVVSLSHAQNENRQNISEKFKLVYRSTKSLQGASISSGISFMEFRKLFQEFTTELLIVRDNIVTSEEQQLYDHYLKVLEVYEDIQTIWEIFNTSKTDVKIVNNQLRLYADKYHFNIVENPMSKNEVIHKQSALEQLENEANTIIEESNRLFLKYSE